MTDDPHETVFPLPLWFVLVVTLLFGLWSPLVFSEPQFQAQVQTGQIITLFDEKCSLTEITNLPFRLTWTDQGKVTEGCFGVRDGMVVMYFSADKTVGLAPTEVFRKVLGV